VTGPPRPTPVRAFLVAVLGAVALLGAAPAPAYACSCAGGSVEEYVDRADVVVVATVVEVDEPLPFLGGEDLTYRAEAETVYKGEVTERFEFRSSSSGASCGLEGIAVDRPLLLFLAERDGSLSGSLCGGTGVVDEDAVQAVLEPRTDQPVTGGPDVRAPLTTFVAVAGVLVLAAVAVPWLLTRRAGRPRRA
jgi:hypothetical protein